MNVKGRKGDNQYLGSAVASKVTTKNLLTLSVPDTRRAVGLKNTNLEEL